MKDFFFFLVFGIISVVLQTTLFYLIPGDFHVDLILVLVVYLGFTRDPALGGILAFCLGYIMDISSGGIRGTFCLSKFVLFLITTTVTRRLFTAHSMLIFLLTALFSILDSLMVLGILQLRGTWRAGGLEMGNLMIQALATGAVAPFVFSLLRRIDIRLTKLQRKKV